MQLINARDVKNAPGPVLRIIWQLLSDPTARFHDLGPDYRTSRINTERKVRNRTAQLTATGFHVTHQLAA